MNLGTLSMAMDRTIWHPMCKRVRNRPLAHWYSAMASYVLSAPILLAHADMMSTSTTRLPPRHSSMSNPGRTMNLVLITSLMDRHLVTLVHCPPIALLARSVSASWWLTAAVDDCCSLFTQQASRLQRSGRPAPDPEPLHPKRHLQWSRVPKRKLHRVSRIRPWSVGPTFSLNHLLTHRRFAVEKEVSQI